MFQSHMDIGKKATIKKKIKQITISTQDIVLNSHDTYNLPKKYQQKALQFSVDLQFCTISKVRDITLEQFLNLSTINFLVWISLCGLRISGL